MDDGVILRHPDDTFKKARKTQKAISKFCKYERGNQKLCARVPAQLSLRGDSRVSPPPEHVL